MGEFSAGDGSLYWECGGKLDDHSAGAENERNEQRRGLSAIPGTLYHIALAGYQSDSNSAAAVVGNYNLRLNCRPLALTLTNLTFSTNGAGAVTFGADAILQNFSSNASGPLRVSVLAISGISTVRALTNAPTSTVSNLGIFPTVPTNILAGQTRQIHISGVIPAPDTSAQDAPIAFGAYADLQQQPVTNQWFTVDETLVAFDQWPGVGQIFGPGGGVIRLDPGYVGGSAFNPLTSVAVVGPASVNEGSSATFYGRAVYADSSQYNFTNTVWVASQFTVTNGLFTTGSVSSDTPVALTAQFSSGGFIYNATTNVVVINVGGGGGTVIGPLQLAGGNVIFQLQGSGNRTDIVETATNLATPVNWVPLRTNVVGVSGVWNFTNAVGQVPQRFFRVRN